MTRTETRNPEDYSDGETVGWSGPGRNGQTGNWWVLGSRVSTVRYLLSPPVTPLLPELLEQTRGSTGRPDRGPCPGTPTARPVTTHLTQHRGEGGEGRLLLPPSSGSLDVWVSYPYQGPQDRPSGPSQTRKPLHGSTRPPRGPVGPHRSVKGLTSWLGRGTGGGTTRRGLHLYRTCRPGRSRRRTGPQGRTWTTVEAFVADEPQRRVVRNKPFLSLPF